MKSRYTTLDIQAALAEILNSDAPGLRVVNVYDIDSKTYLIKLSGSEKKVVILIESGNRIHTTEFDWPKNLMPSGFSMKCRKHLRGKRLSAVNQLGVDRIVDFCFGYGEAAYHFIVELYDRGNIILTDYEYTILQLLRVRKDNEDVRFAVREKYPVEKAKGAQPMITEERLKEILLNAKAGEQLKKVLNPQLIFGPALLEHCLLEAGFPGGCKVGAGFKIEEDVHRLLSALENAQSIMDQISTTNPMGYIVQKKEKKPQFNQNTNEEELLTYAEFHPYLFKQHQASPLKEFPSFNKAVDEFFSKLESQKLDVKTLQQEKTALKKLDNVKQDHVKRLEALQKFQDEGMHKAALIELNLPLVDQAIKVVNSAIANQIDWEEINDILKDAQSQGDPVACSIVTLKLDTNQIMMKLIDPYDFQEDSQSDDEESDVKKKKTKPQATKTVLIEIDLGISAFANSRHYHNKRRQAATKEQKTIDASKKALKNAERKTKQTLKDVATSAVINKARKSYWFEKFLWCISSDNYLFIAGRDQQQNELLVKRYLSAGDLYVHADLHGASSIVLKNPSGQPVPPRTLNEAGTMAICHSVAWQARVVTSAWWVYHNQVSKTAQSGEYLTTGSFMIRGKKNYLPPSYLMMGFGIMFKLEETCVAKHANERRPKQYDDDTESVATEATDNTDNPENEIALDDSEDEEDKNEADDTNEENKENEKNGHDEPSHENNASDEGQEEEEEEEESLYPDTSLQLQYVAGDKYELQRGLSAASSKHTNEDDQEDGGVYLGDGEKVVFGQKQEQQKKQGRLSAKQRRELKKKAKPGKSPDALKELDESEETPEITKRSVKIESKQPQQKEQQQQPPPPKRGHKGKLKKMKEKYKDQDDDEKELVMQFLASAGDAKEPKNKKKAKKVAKLNAGGQMPKKNRQQQQPLILSSESFIVEHAAVIGITQGTEDSIKTEEEGEKANADQGEEDEDAAAVEGVDKENISVLDTLTGCPFQDDLLLFAVPVCAPYTVMQNFKYKVKVTPGTGRKGKAAKSALHLFSTSKEANQREKDLLKSLKDVDVSRNIPGKVKISAPKLQKSKK